MTTTEPQPRPRRNIAAILIVGFMLTALGAICVISWNSGSPVATQDVAATTQNCTKPTGKVGDLCATANHEHGMTVTRTYVTQQYTDGGLYTYLQDTTVQLNYGDDATLDKLCTAATVASLSPDHSDYNYQRQIINRDYCGGAQKAKNAGNSTECFRTLNEVATNTPLVFTIENIENACKATTQPKGKSALVQTTPDSRMLNDTPWYTDPSKADQSVYAPAA